MFRKKRKKLKIKKFMFITLQQSADRNGYQGLVTINLIKVLQFKEVAITALDGSCETDDHGPVTYVDVIFRGHHVSVSETMSSILEKIKNAQTN